MAEALAQMPRAADGAMGADPPGRAPNPMKAGKPDRAHVGDISAKQRLTDPARRNRSGQSKALWTAGDDRGPGARIETTAGSDRLLFLGGSTK